MYKNERTIDLMTYHQFKTLATKAIQLHIKKMLMIYSLRNTEYKLYTVM